MPAFERTLPPGTVIAYPNREKASSQTTKAIVVLLLLVSVALMLVVTAGGYNKLQGLVPINFLWSAVYVVIAVYVARWARGLLPIAMALAILLLILSLISGLGGSGTSWFQRSDAGYAPTQSIFGGGGLSPDMIGILVLAIAPVQLLLIAFCAQGFAQGWNVEVERRVDDTAPVPA